MHSIICTSASLWKRDNGGIRIIARLDIIHLTNVHIGITVDYEIVISSIFFTHWETDLRFADLRIFSQ
jgi:hypothetical protein